MNPRLGKTGEVDTHWTSRHWFNSRIVWEAGRNSDEPQARGDLRVQAELRPEPVPLDFRGKLIYQIIAWEYASGCYRFNTPLLDVTGMEPRVDAFFSGAADPSRYIRRRALHLAELKPAKLTARCRDPILLAPQALGARLNPGQR